MRRANGKRIKAMNIWRRRFKTLASVFVLASVLTATGGAECEQKFSKRCVAVKDGLCLWFSAGGDGTPGFILILF